MAYKMESRTTTIEAAIGDAYGELQSLRDEVREVVDNASGTPAENTGRIQTMGDTADSLDNFVDDEPEVPDGIGDLKVDYSESVNKDKRRGPSRAVRCSNAQNMLQAAAEALRAWVEGDGAKHENKSDAEELAEKLDEHASECDSLEFPGMMG